MPHGFRQSRTASSGQTSSGGRASAGSGDRTSAGRAGRTNSTRDSSATGRGSYASGRPARRTRPAGSGSAPASRRSQSSRQTPPARPAANAQQSELDRALAAAAAAPQPTPATFGELGLDERLVAALAAQGITEPFAIQARALPDALAGRNVLGKAQTGSGKTLAFGLPMLNRLAASTEERQPKTPLGLVLVPTRELAQQVADVLAPLGRRIDVDVTTVYGGVPINRQIDRVRHADVIVATPGRLIDLLERNACRLGGITISVIDEADHMADLGFMPAVTQILDQVPANGQRMFFSATLDRDVAKLVTAYVADPALHAVPAPADSSPAEHSVLVLNHDDKVPVAAEIAARPGRTLFFVRTKHGADRLAKQLTRAGVGAAVIHGDRNQNQRQRALDGFAAGFPRVLVATDVAARGIHIDDVDLVVQFDPPGDHKDYLHRSGRTARAGASGMVVALVEQGQVREMQKMHDAVGVTAARHDVVAGDRVVRQLATSGTPIAPPPRARSAGTTARRDGVTPAKSGGRRRSASRGSRRPSAAGAPAPRRES
jgi:superfamily II DNA/RNA helicase